MHLLAMGKSIRTLKDQPSPYKMKGSLPKLRIETEKSASSNEEHPVDDQSQVSDADTEVVDVKEVTIGKGKSSVLPAWVAFRRRLGRQTEREGFVQTELSLEAVRVVRNDLHEPASSQVERRQQVKTNQTVIVADHWWVRMQRRLFARGRKQA